MKFLNAHNFDEVIDWVTFQLDQFGRVVDVGEWQAIREDIPQTKTFEIEDLSFEMPIGPDQAFLQLDVKPNLPWAEDHFNERIAGAPLNPPPSHLWWPYSQRSNEQHVGTTDYKFSHTYPERFWPKFAESLSIRYGIRFEYGDLRDVISLLKERLGTRQAYLPVWFPEDGSAALEGHRVPCTLGYHFLVRRGNLKIVYYIRSCDFYRHFRDDVYMAARLAQWVAEQVQVKPFRFVMHISSMHIFATEIIKLQNEAAEILARKMR